MTGLANVLPEIFGYYLVQIGMPSDAIDVLCNSKIHQKIIVNPKNDSTNSSAAVQCNLEELPFLPESIDAVLLFHTLEFVKKPEVILKEIYDALINGGNLIIFGFNPQSLWGIVKLFKHSKSNIWGGNWYSPKKLRHWLLKIGFSVGDYQSFYFRPPSENPEKMLFMAGIGQMFWPYCGASYMFVVKKTSTIVTPIKELSPRLVKEAPLIKGIPKPSSRVTQCNRNN